MLRRASLVACILGLVALVVACSGPDKTLETSVKGLQTKIDALQAKVDTATQADTTLKTDLATQTNLVKQLQTKVTALETTLQNHMNPPLALEIKSLTSPVLQGGSVTLVVKTEPGARVSVSLKLPAGQIPPSGLTDKTTGKNGEAKWTWKVAKNLPAGSYVVQVSAQYQNRSASGNTNLVVTAPAPAPAKTPTK
jgi:hypothetical protein